MATAKKKVSAAAEKVSDDVTAVKIEAKKTTRAASRKAKETATKVALDVEDAKANAADKKAATEIEVKKAAAKVKKTTKKGVEKVKAVEEEVKKPVKKAKAAKMTLVFESRMGGHITPEEIAAKVPKGSDAAYIKLEENKIYWVKGEETGSVEIW